MHEGLRLGAAWRPALAVALMPVQKGGACLHLGLQTGDLYAAVG